eukprot:Sdes_comp15676_c0_seq1m4697
MGRFRVVDEEINELNSSDVVFEEPVGYSFEFAEGGEDCSQLSEEGKNACLNGCKEAFLEGSTSSSEIEMKEMNDSFKDLHQEENHFQSVVRAFEYYSTHALQQIAKSEGHYRKLSEHHQTLLSHFPMKFSQLRKAVSCNYMIVKKIIAPHQVFENSEFLDTERAMQNALQNFSAFDSVQQAHPSEIFAPKNVASNPAAEVPSLMDIEKVQSTLKLFVRDWSVEGAPERDVCYRPIVEEIVRRFGKVPWPGKHGGRRFSGPSCRFLPRRDIQILVPGSGLGRLAYEIAREGFRCQGNEVSFFMLLASNFILNRSEGAFHYTFYPWIHQSSNHQSTEDQFRSVSFPDIDPSRLPADADFSMSAGDFLQIHYSALSLDCVATCFFIDTAANVVAYIEKIWKILKPGGCWINFGPLLYHYSDISSSHMSIELSLEEVLDVTRSFGFVIDSQRRDIRS